MNRDRALTEMLVGGAEYTTAQTDAIVITPSDTDRRIHIESINISTTAANTISVRGSTQMNGATKIIYNQYLGTNGNREYKIEKTLANNENLRITSSAATPHSITVNYYEEPAIL